MTGIDTDDLYGLPLERFVPERAALAKALRADGRRDEAAAVARLPKPSVAAWVVNQLVRGHRDQIKSLLDAGDALRAAQEAVIEGRGDGHSLRAAAERERAAADELLGAARDLSGTGGPALSDTIIDRVADTLHAAAFDEDAREQVGAGRLERELRHVGLGGALAAAPSAPTGGARKPRAAPTGGARKARAVKPGGAAARKKAKADEAAARKAAKQAEARAREATKQAEAAAREARQAEAQARRRAERASRAVTRAEERQAQAAQALQEADEALAAARSESEAADEALAAAHSEAEAATEAHRGARENLAAT